MLTLKHGGVYLETFCTSQKFKYEYAGIINEETILPNGTFVFLTYMTSKNS